MYKLLWLYGCLLLLAVNSAEDLKCYVCDDCATEYEQYSQICTFSNDGSEVSIHDFGGSGSTESVTEGNNSEYSSTSSSGPVTGSTEDLTENTTERSYTEASESGNSGESVSTEASTNTNILENEYTTEKDKLPGSNSVLPLNVNVSNGSNSKENSTENTNNENSLGVENIGGNYSDDKGDNLRTDVSGTPESNLGENSTQVSNFGNTTLESGQFLSNDSESQSSTNENIYINSGGIEPVNVNENSLPAVNTEPNTSQTNNIVENLLEGENLNITGSNIDTNGNKSPLANNTSSNNLIGDISEGNSLIGIIPEKNSTGITVTDGNISKETNFSIDINEPQIELSAVSIGESSFTSSNDNSLAESTSNYGFEVIDNPVISGNSNEGNLNSIKSSSKESKTNNSNLNKSNGEKINENSSEVLDINKNNTDKNKTNIDNTGNNFSDESNSNFVDHGLYNLTLSKNSINTVCLRSTSSSASNGTGEMIAENKNENIDTNRTDENILSDNGIEGKNTDSGGLNEEIVSETSLNFNITNTVNNEPLEVNMNKISSKENNSNVSDFNSSNSQAKILENGINGSNISASESTKETINSASSNLEESALSGNTSEENTNGNLIEGIISKEINSGEGTINGSSSAKENVNDTEVWNSSLKGNKNSTIVLNKISPNEIPTESASKKENEEERVSQQSNMNNSQPMNDTSKQESINNANKPLIDNMSTDNMSNDNPINDSKNKSSNALENTSKYSKFDSTGNINTSAIDVTDTGTSGIIRNNFDTDTEVNPNGTSMISGESNDTVTNSPFSNATTENTSSTNDNDFTTPMYDVAAVESTLATSTEPQSTSVSSIATENTTISGINNTSTASQKQYSVQMVGDANSQYDSASRGSLLRVVRQVKGNAIQGLRCVTTSYQENGKTKVKRGCSSAGDPETRCSQLLGNSSAIKSCKVCQGGLCNSGFKTVISLVPIFVSVIVHFM